MKFKVAVVQFDTQQYEPSLNLARAENFIANAKSQKADVIIFPEDFITGPLIRRPDLEDTKYHYRDYFIGLACKYKIDIIPGSIIERDKKGVSNVSYYIDHLGKVKARYCKINLWLPERNNISAGNTISVFSTRFGKAGIVICWDLAFPEIFRKMVRSGVEIVYCPSWWAMNDAPRALKHTENAETNAINAFCAARALENGIALIYCNAAEKIDVGKYHDTLIGCSQVCVPFYGTISKLDHNRENMFITEIDTSLTSEHEKAYRIRQDLKERNV